jgi:multiple sugar transport system permease protein
MKRSGASRIVRILVIFATIVWSLAPILVGLITSISTQAEVQAGTWLPKSISLSAYGTLFRGQQGPNVLVPSESSSFVHSMINSITVSAETVPVIIVVALFAGYGLSHLRFPGRRIVLVALVGALIVPIFALITPLFRIIATTHLIDTHIGLLFIYVSANAPLAVWLFYNYSREIPPEPERAALIDGCTRFQAFVHVVLPQMVSGIAAIAAITTLFVWGEFLLPLLFAPTLATKPVTVLITEFVGKYSTNYPVLTAAGIVSLVPPAIIAIALSRHIRGLLGGATSG